MCVEIPLHNGMVALIDEDDLDRVSVHRWHAKRCKRTWYAATNVCVDGTWRYLRLHRLVTNAPTGSIVDHKNGDGLDCRKSNLRFVTALANAWNQRPKPRRNGQPKKSPFKGVKLSKSGNWEAAIVHLGTPKHLGTFATQEEAARAYDAAARELRGEYAWLNFPDE